MSPSAATAAPPTPGPSALSRGLRTVSGWPLVATLTSLLVLVVAWWPLSLALQPFLPTPWTVAESLVTATTGSDLYENLGITLRRIAIGSIVAFSLGSAFAILIARNRVLEFVFLPWVLIGLAIPSAAAALASILFLGLAEYASLLALLVIVTPYVMNVVYQGARALEPQLAQAAQVYRFSRFETLRHVMLPQMAPSLLSAARLAFAFSWKNVVIVEALTRPSGIGSELAFFFRTLRAEDVIAYTLVFSVVMLAVELLFFRSIDRRVFRWRTEAASL